MTNLQSVLFPAGAEASSVFALFWIMVAGGIVILTMVLVFLALSLWAGPATRNRLSNDRFIMAAGLFLPIVVLTALLAYGLSLTGMRHQGADATALRIVVVGEQWWWRVFYEGPDGRLFETANEIHLPVGRPVRLELKSADVIHSFWVPNIAGKLDMIPGRTNVLMVTATEPGLYRGQCAEYCGGAHAFMALFVRSLPETEFLTWLASQIAPAVTGMSHQEQAGRIIFTANGCGACHRVRGLAPAGSIGPDLTHVGGRVSLAAGALPNTPDAMARWITHGQSIKPENGMPEFRIFTPGELAALSAYLASLK